MVAADIIDALCSLGLEFPGVDDAKNKEPAASLALLSAVVSFSSPAFAQGSFASSEKEVSAAVSLGGPRNVFCHDFHEMKEIFASDWLKILVSEKNLEFVQ